MTAIENPLFLHYQFALVRGLSTSFENCLKLGPPVSPILLDLAHRQHENYIDLIKKCVPHVIVLPGDPKYPDCNFIEDTVVIVGDTAVVSRLGAKERRGEECAVAEALQNLGWINPIFLAAPGTMDGGDILFTGRHLLVGLTRRTNLAALEQLQELFSKKIPVIGISVTESLHLKSLISQFDTKTLVVADTREGHGLRDEIHSVTDGAYQFVFVPDPVASNVLRIGSTLIVQQGFPKSESILQNLCKANGVSLVTLEMSELIKADGALTCGSVLF